MWITDDSDLLLKVLEIHDDHLIVVGMLTDKKVSSRTK